MLANAFAQACLLLALALAAVGTFTLRSAALELEAPLDAVASKVLVLSAAMSELKWTHRLKHQGQLETHNSLCLYSTFCGQRGHHHQDRLQPKVWCVVGSRVRTELGT